ncbi:hypothetical protein P154DRAFT_207621 [Amniculicola lignicola CBS 123094]|uniref:Uncharacterized protein n=1 Tax=Amniculicola lignicola CBS 123094 TaxID=1392246 RepID=A0A6A5WIS5_9PLEO|nr:hypothetical protein P154DRAFT_207621 [Amniculicola lignicola CBS 123094]
MTELPGHLRCNWRAYYRRNCQNSGRNGCELLQGRGIQARPRYYQMCACSERSILKRRMEWWLRKWAAAKNWGDFSAAKNGYSTTASSTMVGIAMAQNEGPLRTQCMSNSCGGGKPTYRFAFSSDRALHTSGTTTVRMNGDLTRMRTSMWRSWTLRDMPFHRHSSTAPNGDTSGCILVGCGACRGLLASERADLAAWMLGMSQ